MECAGEFPEDHAFVELLVPGVSSETDMEQLLKDTDDKLSVGANRSVRALKKKTPLSFYFSLNLKGFWRES